MTCEVSKSSGVSGNQPLEVELLQCKSSDEDEDHAEKKENDNVPDKPVLLISKLHTTLQSSSCWRSVPVKLWSFHISFFVAQHLFFPTPREPAIRLLKYEYSALCRWAQNFLSSAGSYLCQIVSKCKTGLKALGWVGQVTIWSCTTKENQWTSRKKPYRLDPALGTMLTKYNYISNDALLCTARSQGGRWQWCS